METIRELVCGIDKRKFFLVFAILLAAAAANASFGFAAGTGFIPHGEETTTIAQAGTGLGGEFDENLKTLVSGTLKALHIILIVMTAIAGMMIAFGLEDGKKFLWQAMLGIGLAFNFGAFLVDTDLWSLANEDHKTAHIEYYKPDLVTKDAGKAEDVSILGGFLDHYEKKVITPGAENIMPYCLRLLIILAVVQASWELSLKFMSGDKLQYLIHMTLKIGFFMFLMTNWIKLMTSLGEGFQMLGEKAGGGSLTLGQTCNKIVSMTITAAAGIYGDLHFNSLGLMLVVIAALVILTYCLFMVALEIFMAKIEFLTMALLTIPLLAFGVMSKFAFLAEKGIGAMFNLAIKLSVVGFIGAMSVPFIESFVNKLPKSSSLIDDMGVILQIVLASGMVYLLTKKAPALVSGLLNGSPQLSGSDMIGTIKSGANTAVNAAAAVAGQTGTLQAARAAASFAGQGGVTGTLTQLGRNYAMGTRPVQSYRNSISSFQKTLQDTGERTLNQIRNGQNSSGEQVMARPGGNAGAATPKSDIDKDKNKSK